MSTILDLVRAVPVVIPNFNKKESQMGKMSKLKRVFQILEIVVNA